MCKEQRRSLCRCAALGVMCLFVGASLGCNSCGKNQPFSLTWSVLDKTTNVATTSLASGTTFTINSGDQYIVTLNAIDPNFIKEMDVSGGGTVQCTARTGGGATFSCSPVANNLIPKQTTTINSSGTYQGFVMSAPFKYADIACGSCGSSCGSYGNLPCSASGVVQVKGNETSWTGASTPAILYLTP